LSDRFDDELKRAAKRNLDKINSSAVFLALFNEKMAKDPICLMQMGLAIYLDKPIALLVPEGAVIPENLRRVAQKIEYFRRDEDDPSCINDATDRLMRWLETSDERFLSEIERREKAEDQALIATAPELLQAATAAWHLCESLLAVREGATDDLIREVRDAAKAAIEKAGGEAER